MKRRRRAVGCAPEGLPRPEPRVGLPAAGGLPEGSGEKGGRSFRLSVLLVSQANPPARPGRLVLHFPT